MAKKEKTPANVPAKRPSVFGMENSKMDVGALAGRAREVADENPQKAFLSFSGKTGKLEMGRDKTAVQPDDLFVVNVHSFTEGFVCWKASKPIHRRMANIFTDKPILMPADDEDGPFKTAAGEGWHGAKGVVLKHVAKGGLQVDFTTNSASGVNEIADLLGKFADRAEEGLPSWPVVSITAEQFESNGFKNFKPVFTVVHWLTGEQLEAMMGGKTLEEVLDE